MAFYGTAAGFKLHALPAAALTSPVTDPIIEDHLSLASGKADSYLRGRHSLPLDSPAPAELVAAIYAIAAYSLIVWRGFNPDEFDAAFRLKYEDAIAWLRDLSSGKANLSVTADATDSTFESGAAVEVGSLRGWNIDETGLNGIGEPIGNFWGAPKID